MLQENQFLACVIYILKEKTDNKGVGDGNKSLYGVKCHEEGETQGEDALAELGGGLVQRGHLGRLCHP